MYDNIYVLQNTCMTMKLIDILNEDEVDYEPLKNILNFNVVPFEYGTVYFQYIKSVNIESNVITLPISVYLNKMEPDMFDKSYLAYAQKIKSLFGDKYDLENIKLKIDEAEGKMLDVFTMDLMPYLSNTTKNTLTNDNPSVERILKGGYHVEVDMNSLPHVTDDTYDMINKKKEHGKSVFEFLEDGTLSNGTSYKLIFLDDELYHNHKESSGRHLDYSDINIEIFAETDKDFPLTDEERDEVKRKFKMYDVKLIIKRT